MNESIQSWKNTLTYAYNAFSTPLLLRTLFAPWQDDTASDNDVSFFERFLFVLFSRFMGFIARTFLIIIGLIFCILIIATFPFFILFNIKVSKDFLVKQGSVGSSLSYGNTYHLNKHSSDAISSSYLNIYGKEKALRMIERALDKDMNHNILIVGENGVGKTTLISYLGRLGQSGLSFPSVSNHRVAVLHVEGMNEADIARSLHEAHKARNVLVVIENIHNFPNLFEIIMPYLHTSHLGVIVTTDFSNYDQVLKKYPEFTSKFEKVDIEPTNTEDTINILFNNSYGINLTTEIAGEIVKLSDRFISHEVQPTKSLLILEELRTLKKKDITVDDVRTIISDKTNIPIGSLGQDEKKVLVGIEAKMKEKIIGQDEAVHDVSQALKRLRTGIADPSKPAGSFLFLGSTGVGKTYTAKILAESYFGRRDAMIRFDMSEFSQGSSVEDFTEQLGKVIEEAPLSLVFLDELEKSNRLIHNLLLQVLDEGRLTRKSGREVSFKESIIITTSNAGSKEIIANRDVEKKVLINHLIEQGIFVPEFLNRFSDIILFKPLTNTEAHKIAELLLLEFASRLKQDKDITLDVTPELVDAIASAGFDPDFGARPLKRAIEDIVENKVADYIIAGNTGGSLKIL